MTDQEYLRELASLIVRVGMLEDVPEGARTIRQQLDEAERFDITDTLARELAERLRRIADHL